MGKIIGKVSNVFCILLIIVLVVFEILQYTKTIYVLQVQTGSMETSIFAGDYIIVKKEDKSKYKPGDIVTFKVKDYYVTHRIQSINGDNIITKGDANNSFDEETDLDNVVGKVVYKGDLLNFIFKYRLLLVIIAIALFVISWLFDDAGESSDKEKIDKKEKYKRKKEEKEEFEDLIEEDKYKEFDNDEVIDNNVEEVIEKEEVVEEVDNKVEEDTIIKYEDNDEEFIKEMADSIKVIEDNNINNTNKKKKKKKKKKKNNISQDNNSDDLEII